jgi:hypothetical protein
MISGVLPYLVLKDILISGYIYNPFLIKASCLLLASPGPFTAENQRMQLFAKMFLRFAYKLLITEGQDGGCVKTDKGPGLASVEQFFPYAIFSWCNQENINIIIFYIFTYRFN